MKKSELPLQAKSWAISFWPALALIALWPLGHFVQDPAYCDPYFARIICLIGLNISLAVSLQIVNGISGQFSLGHAGFMAVGAYMAAYPAQAMLSTDPANPHVRLLNNPLAPLLFYMDIGIVVLAIVAAIAVLVLLFRWLKLPNWAMAIVLVAVGAWIIIDFANGSARDAVAPYLIWSSLAHWLGALFTWILDAGLPLTHSISAYSPRVVAQPLTCLVLIVGGGLCATVASLVIGVPVLRLRGDYLAIATLGFAEIIAVMINNSQSLGGALGLSDIPRFAGFSWIYGIAGISCVSVWRLSHSAHGRAMIAVREDEIAAAAIGINAARSRILAFMVGAFFAGMAGALFAHFEGYITPRHFSFMRSIELVVMVTLAGAGSISGTILAAIVLTLLPELLRGFSEFRMVIYSLLLIVMMLARPNGLLGGRELLWRKRKRVDAAA